MDTSHALACTTRVGVRCTGCQCLESIGRRSRRGCRQGVVSAVKARCRPAARPPQCNVAGRRWAARSLAGQILSWSTASRDPNPPPCVHPKPTTPGVPWNLLGLCSLHTSLVARAACRHAAGLPPTRRSPKQEPTSGCASSRPSRPKLVSVDARAPARRAQPSARSCLRAAHCWRLQKKTECLCTWRLRAVLLWALDVPGKA